MATNEEIIRNLTEEESLELMAGQTFGRLVVQLKNDVDIFPVNFAVHDGKIYFRTAEGTKLFGAARADDLILEADHVDQDASVAWSVVVRGPSRILTKADEILEAEEYGVKPWIPTLKYNFVEITPRTISGREFQLGEEPERY
ncbi:pyridoxamine 5'-phosphate oxidase family protein [Corynebacterium cystitidis]|uniref:Nitroimidazol reductase NimA, pyridoxamine 5'-phosphate oxidase superfamily n=1 Tax=Corynebacterium cystitidis DSM 20524 TaxID=1121357 RepID=A0A1H9VPV7_9CORY|nr:pyridoxamine 5'-phosphate oxidase family protein [Corynebacterium cystitidis]WJY82846.1 Pyridoxamine 5'-phosphate oxidase [Corynebacterium cystitidis DSM 20524]SES23820.1 Nitroimidazol reductase NimA, pyridoxamine 5'-phosphate oxidase superfamily [Corynebacterium cystitidis DSM 20524]SNV69861.1 Pyridoxamine 5'-phosphate oxidase [Corynebacterium cystitidis]